MPSKKIIQPIHRNISNGVVHKTPIDLKKSLIANPRELKLWQDISPLARNEWICWVTSAKQTETRKRRIKVGLSKLKSGMRRPCCWAGCTHRSSYGK